MACTGKAARRVRCMICAEDDQDNDDEDSNDDDNDYDDQEDVQLCSIIVSEARGQP